MATEITTVVFDLGGVLIDWNPRHLYRKVFGDDIAAMDAVIKKIEQQIRKRHSKVKATKHKVGARVKRTRQETSEE